MNVRLIADPAEFAALRDEWNALAGARPFRRWEWLASWVETYCDRDSLHVLAVFDDDGRTIGFAPWHLRKNWQNGRCLRFLGDGKACGDDLSLIAAPGREQEVVDAVADWLTADDNAASWDWIRLEGVSASDPLIRRLTETLDAWGATPLVRDDLSRWLLPLSTSWDEYVGQFGKNGRHHARSARRKVEDPKNGFTYATPRDETECTAMYRTIVDMHQKRWDGQADGGCFSAPRFDEFLHAAVLRWFAEGSLFLRMLSLDGRPLVGGIGVRGGDTLFLYLFGRDPEPEFNDVGKLMNYATIVDSIDGGVRAIDFLRGDETYKGRLGAAPVPQVVVEIAGRGVFNRLRMAATTGRAVAKRIVRRQPEPAAE